MAADVTIEDKAKYLVQEKELREQLRKLRFDHALGQLDDTSKIKKSRRELARVMTILGKISKM